MTSSSCLGSWVEGGKGCFCCGRGISPCLVCSKQERPRPSLRSVLSGQRDTTRAERFQPLSEEQRGSGRSGEPPPSGPDSTFIPSSSLLPYFQEQHQFAEVFLHTFDVFKNTDLISGLYWSRAVSVRTENIQLFLFPYFRKLSQPNE